MDGLSLKLIALSCLLIVFSQTSFVKPVQTATLSVSYPLQYSFLSLGRNLRQEFSFWLNLRNIWRENLYLKERVGDLERDLSQEKEVSLENELLRSQLNLSQRIPLRSLSLARVVGKSVGPDGSFLLLDKGEEDQVKDGQKVVFKNFLVGVISETSATASKVRLIVDPEIKVGALDQDSKDRARGIVGGEFAMGLSMEKILPGQQLAMGDKIITSGEGGYPRGLLIGEVVSFSSSSADVLKWAKLKPLIDLYSLEEVFVVK